MSICQDKMEQLQLHPKHCFYALSLRVWLFHSQRTKLCLLLITVFVLFGYLLLNTIALQKNHFTISPHMVKSLRSNYENDRMMLRTPRSQIWHSVCWIPVILCKYYLNTCDLSEMRARGLPAPRWSNSGPPCLHSTGWVVFSVLPSPHSFVSLYYVHDIILFSNYHRDDANTSPCYYTSDQSMERSIKGNTLLSTERGAQRQGEARE